MAATIAATNESPRYKAGRGPPGERAPDPDPGGVSCASPAAAPNAANVTNGGVGAAALNAANFPGPVFAFRHVVPPSRFVPPLPRPPSLRRDPYSRAIAGGRGRVSAPARFARLIARARARHKRRAHFARWPNRGLFSRRREPGKQSGPARMPLSSFPAILAQTGKCQAISGELFQNIFEQDMSPDPAASLSMARDDNRCSCL